MNAWNLTAHNRRARKRAAVRWIIALSVVGEAYGLWHYGMQADYVGAYLIVSAWVKDTLRRIITEVWGQLCKGLAPIRAAHPPVARHAPA